MKIQDGSYAMKGLLPFPRKMPSPCQRPASPAGFPGGLLVSPMVWRQLELSLVRWILILPNSPAAPRRVEAGWLWPRDLHVAGQGAAGEAAWLSGVLVHYFCNLQPGVTERHRLENLEPASRTLHPGERV